MMLALALEHAHNEEALSQVACASTQLVALVELLAATGVVLGLDNWFRWLLEEDRWFPDWDAVAERLEQHQTGLEEALGCLATSPATGLTQGRR